MKLKIKETDGVPVTGSPGRSRTDGEQECTIENSTVWGGVVVDKSGRPYIHILTLSYPKKL